MSAELLIKFGPLNINLNHQITIVESARLHGHFTLKQGNYEVQGDNMSVTIAPGFATISVEWRNDQEQPVKVTGPTSWESSDPSITVEVSTGNPLIANIHAPSPGSATITATANADTSGNTREVSASVDIVASATAPPASEATHGVMTVTQYPSQIQGRK